MDLWRCDFTLSHNGKDFETGKKEFGPGSKCGSCLELLTNPLITFWLKRLMKTNKLNKSHELIGRGNKNNSSYTTFSRI